MQLLEQKRIDGEIYGLNITQDKDLLVQMFADNMGIFVYNLEENYTKTREVIRLHR